MSNKKTALFPGSFDPFTLGHLSLVQRGLQLMDEIVVAVGVNDAKRCYFTLEERLEMLTQLFADEPRVRVVSYDALTAFFAESVGAQFMLRGVRTVSDFEYEQTVADVNRKLTGVETVLLFAPAELNHVSSTVVRELLRYGKSVQGFVPEGLVLPQK